MTRVFLEYQIFSSQAYVKLYSLSRPFFYHQLFPQRKSLLINLDVSSSSGSHFNSK